MQSEPIQALARVIADNHLDATMGQQLTALYSPFFEAAALVCEEATKIPDVTDPTDADGIEESKALRLALKTLRCDADRKRKGLADGVNRLKNAIQFGYNLLAQQIEPVEARLQANEDIAERLAAARTRKLGEERCKLLAPYGVLHDEFNIKAFGAMDDGQFEAAHMRYQGAAEAAARAEALHKADEEAARKHAAELAVENERLRKDQAAKDAAYSAQLKAQRDSQAKERAAAEEKARLERAAAEAIARKEREARAQAEAELQAKRDAEAATLKAEVDAQRRAASAPDAEKLLALADAIRHIAVPACTTEAGQTVCRQARGNLDSLDQWIVRQVTR